MVEGDVFTQDLDRHKQSLIDFQGWLRDIFYAGDTFSFLQQARINIMMTGVTFLVDNLSEIKTLYLTHRK